MRFSIYPVQNANLDQGSKIHLETVQKTIGAKLCILLLSQQKYRMTKNMIDTNHKFV